uniref:DDE Tnp4 domain-containing protein n=1 Tax=Myripristis murdjan TaxID=586833 RepID=A0A667XMZ9_9TELE
MACPFIHGPIEEGAQIVRRSLQRERIFLDRSNPLHFADDYLYERYQFSRPGLKYICEILEPHIARVTRRSAALTVPQAVCIVMRFFATGSFMYSVGDAERLNKNTVCRAVHQVASALTNLMDDFIIFPGHLRGRNNAKWQLPAKASKYTLMNNATTCDHTSIITSLDAKWPGCVHNSQVFTESKLHHRLQQGHVNGVLLGDRRYALHPFLMTPYPDPEPGPQTHYNLPHNRTRVKIKNTFGLLKAHFASLRCLRVAPDRACKMISACCVLHNNATIRKEKAPCFDLQPLDVVDPINLEYPTGLGLFRGGTVFFLQH